MRTSDVIKKKKQNRYYFETSVALIATNPEIRGQLSELRN